VSSFAPLRLRVEKLYACMYVHAYTFIICACTHTYIQLQVHVHVCSCTNMTCAFIQLLCFFSESRSRQVGTLVPRGSCGKWGGGGDAPRPSSSERSDKTSSKLTVSRLMLLRFFCGAEYVSFRGGTLYFPPRAGPMRGRCLSSSGIACVVQV
jgi:hypothetical protein